MHKNSSLEIKKKKLLGILLILLSLKMVNLYYTIYIYIYVPYKAYNS